MLKQSHFNILQLMPAQVSSPLWIFISRLAKLPAASVCINKIVNLFLAF